MNNTTTDVFVLSGAILVVKALYELHRTAGRYGLVIMCIGGGQGIAAVSERAWHGSDRYGTVAARQRRSGRWALRPLITGR